jgi:phage repressor protein C with HTH and peptisase S24 domain
MSSGNLKEELGQRLKQARGTFAMTQKEWCAASGMKLPSLRDYELGKTIPGGEALSLYAIAGINLNWLLTGDGPMRLRDLPPTDDRIFVPIPRHTVQGNDGSETEVPSEVASLALSRQWLDGRGLRPSDLVYTRMPDASMNPTIRPGSLVVLDSSSSKFRGDGIYSFVAGEDLVVKRLQIDFNGGLLVRCDNPAYKDQHIDDSYKSRLLGKVIWAGGELQD